uniref:acid-sensing ion channel 5-like isoform X1 n=1 Tax=Styela clava TaxID=7725 RepID=UPI001939BCF1|nr:acid-sensing ion channel 5-like isoform X1 [Styela clava]
MNDKRRTAWDITVAFFNRTTCHGLDQVTEAGRPIIGRLIWLLVIIGLFGGMCWQLIISVQEYTLFATDTELHEEFDSYIDFPAVSICNYNRFFNITDRAELAAVDGLIRTASPLKRLDDDVVWEHAIREYYKDLSHVPLLSKEVENRGWPLNDKTISKCMFTQKPCSYKDFKTFITPMGRCFTFTSKKKIIQSVPGSGHGLLLTLDIMQDYYSEHPEYGRPEAGIKVHVHEHDEAPKVEEFGVGIPAGQMGHLIVKKEERKLMYKPWGICNPTPMKMLYRKEYTFSQCMTECRVQYIVKKCGCKPYWSPIQERAPECSVGRILDCGGPAEALSLTLTPANCSCDQACNSVRYEHRLSYATFPGIEVGEKLSKELHESENKKEITDFKNIDVKTLLIGQKLNLTELDPYRLKLSQYRENHLMLDVYFESLSFTKISQSKKVTEISLAGDIGGLLGLWLGISVVTVGEFVQFFAQLCSNHCDSDDDEESCSSSASGYSLERKNRITPVIVTVDCSPNSPSNYDEPPYSPESRNSLSVYSIYDI